MKNTRRFLASALGVLAIYDLAMPAAFALPLGDERAAAEVQAPSALEIADTGVDFTAIVALSNCSGSLVRFTGSRAEDKAMVLTNGHCFEGGFLEPGEVIIGRPSNRTFKLLNADATQTLATLWATKVLYATMTDTDVTMYQLDVTYADIQASYGVEALTVAEAHQEAGIPIRVVSGYWKRIYACEVDDFVYQLREDDWTFVDAIRYTQPGCETIGGTSGSPVIHADTKEVVGINNTGNEDGERCTMNNPCEVDADGQVTVRHHAAYGQQLYLFYTCLDGDGAIDVNIEGCELPKPVK